MTDPNGLVITRTYGARGRLTSVPPEANELLWLTMRPETAPGVTQPDGSFRAFAYDAAHRLTGLRDALGNSMAFTLDNNDNRVAAATFDSGNNLTQNRSFATRRAETRHPDSSEKSSGLGERKRLEPGPALPDASNCY